MTHTPVATYVQRIRASLVQSPFGPAVIVAHAPRWLTFYLDERASSFPGIHVEELPTRSYPQGGLGGSFLGLVGQVSAAELKTPAYKHAKAGEEVGQSGVEATYDKELNAGFAHARVRVNALGQIASPLHALRSTHAPGRAAADDRRSATARRRESGEGRHRVRAHGGLSRRSGRRRRRDGRAHRCDQGARQLPARQPDARRERPGLSAAAQERHASPDCRSLNRATQGLYPAGSTFKPIVAEAALTDGVITPSSYLACTGSLTVGNIVFHNVEPSINESMNLSQAIAMSCDTWFYQLGERFYFLQNKGLLGIQQWAHWLGLGQPTGIDIPGESGGVVPTPAWLAKTFKGTAESYWYEGTSVNLSIGQGYLEVTPLQMAVAYAALANGGTVVRPHIAQAVLGAHRTVLKFPPVRKLKLTDVSAIRQGLYEAAHSSTGTSTAIFGNFPVSVSGKTGTAQDPHGSDDSWYASWAPSGNPRYVVVVLIEHGGFGANAAAPAAKEIYSALFHVKS